MPWMDENRCVTTCATSSGLRTRTMATKSHSPVTEYASATPSTSASAPPSVGSASREAFTSTTACVMAGLYTAIRYPGQHPRRATVVGAGSFGTAVALLLVRAGVRTTLLCRTSEQAERLDSAGENERSLPGVERPRELKVRVFGAVAGQFRRPAPAEDASLDSKRR